VGAFHKNTLNEAVAIGEGARVALDSTLLEGRVPHTAAPLDNNGALLAAQCSLRARAAPKFNNISDR
jgi:hypothetical protein